MAADSGNNPQQPTLVVIGAGFGGLAAAVRAHAKGYRVVLCEAGPQAGGRARVFKRDGFTFDAGPTVMTAPYLVEELFQLVGKKWQDYYGIMPVDPFYRVIFNDGSRFDYVGDDERLLKQINDFNPADVAGYHKLAAHAKRIFEVGYLQLADRPFSNLVDMLRVIPEMIKLENHRSVYSLVSKYIKDERLRQVFSFEPLLVGGNPTNITSIYLLIHWLERKWGVHFIKGGTGALVEAFVNLLKDIGVDVRLNAPVGKIDVNDQGQVTGVQLENGEKIACQVVVANADPGVVYTKMIDAKKRKKHTDRSIARKKHSMGLFVIYFGVKKTYPELAHHTIILGPRYQGLLDDIFEKKVLADDFSLYLHAPTRSDPSLGPDGCETFYVLSPVPNNKSGIDWSKEGQKYCDKILDFLDQTHVPGLRENLVTSHYVTPDYFQHDLRSLDGAAFGIEPRLTQSAYFRYHNESEDVKGLYFVGAGTHPGAGVPGVICSAKVLERVLPSATSAHANTHANTHANANA